MHKLHSLVRHVNKTHKGLGQLIAINLVYAKAKKCILNVASAGCGKSAATEAVAVVLKQDAMRFTSLTLAGLKHVTDQLTQYTGHIIVDDLGQEKSEWSRTSTVTVIANLVHTHNVRKLTREDVLEIENFNGSAALNIQPVMMQSIVTGDDWIAVVRDKVLRYYHLFRPIEPKGSVPMPDMNTKIQIADVTMEDKRDEKWYTLVSMCLIQWSYARVIEHLPSLLKACAALDNRTEVNDTDYDILIKLLKPMQIERYVLQSYGLETGRVFDNNLYCLMVEIASHGEPTVDTAAIDYKCSPQTIIRVAEALPDYFWLKPNSPRHLMPKELTANILETCGVKEEW